MKVVRKYGKKPYQVILLHGGPGAPGSLRPVAQKLAKKFGVLEHLQTAQTISGQLLEIKKIIDENSQSPVVVVGHSWGGMLGFIFAAKYPRLVKKLILVSSGVFEEKYAKNIMTTRLSRMTKQKRKRFDNLMEELEKVREKKKDQIFSKIGRLIGEVDSCQRLRETRNEMCPSYETYLKIWKEAEKLRLTGKLLEMGKKISCPVVAIHGDWDPHPLEGIKEPLEKVLSDFSLIVLKKCGHEPWLEKEAKDKFFRELEKEIDEQKKVIIFFGVPGAGKSFLGKKLARRIGYYFYEADVDFEYGGYRERLIDERKEIVLNDFYQKIAVKIKKYWQGNKGVVVASALGTDKYRKYLFNIFQSQVVFVWIKPDKKKHLRFLVQREEKSVSMKEDDLVKELKNHLRKKVKSFEKPSVDCLVIKNDYTKKTEKDLLKVFF